MCVWYQLWLVTTKLMSKKRSTVRKHDTKPHVTTNREARGNDMIRPNKMKRKQPHDQNVKPNHWCQFSLALERRALIGFRRECFYKLVLEKKWHLQMWQMFCYKMAIQFQHPVYVRQGFGPCTLSFSFCSNLCFTASQGWDDQFVADVIFRGETILYQNLEPHQIEPTERVPRVSGVIWRGIQIDSCLFS